MVGREALTQNKKRDLDLFPDQAGAMLRAKRIRLPSLLSSHGVAPTAEVSNSSQQMKFMRSARRLGDVERRSASTRNGMARVSLGKSQFKLPLLNLAHPTRSVTWF